MTTRERVKKILALLNKVYPDCRCALHFRSPWQLLVATILSAQCTDERVNKVTPILFQHLKTVENFADVSQAELEKYIHSTGFYRNKSRNIRAAAKMIIDRFHGRVPRTMEKMLQIPGVARKTANVVLTVAYGVIEGVAVDTHVKRLSVRLGLTQHADPDKIERDLMKLLPQNEWGNFSMLLIWHGRRVCTARQAFCKKCVVSDVCKSAFRI